MATDETFAEWVILELFGHRRLAGYLTEQEIAGQGFLRLEIPEQATQFYSPSAVYGITPTTEEIARRVAKGSNPAPIHQWELPAAPQLDYPQDEDTDRISDEPADETPP